MQLRCAVCLKKTDDWATGLTNPPSSEILRAAGVLLPRISIFDRVALEHSRCPVTRNNFPAVFDH